MFVKKEIVSAKKGKMDVLKQAFCANCLPDHKKIGL
jgi:hypothetical protein